jgi:hypothetical protein
MSTRSLIHLPLALLLLPLRLAAEPPSPTAAPGILLTITGVGSQPVTMTAADLAALPRATVKAKEGDKEALFGGVPLGKVLEKAGAPSGSAMHGPNLASYLVVEARDGYKVVFALPELDASYTDHVVLLADRRDGKPFPEAEGPLFLVVPGDKRPSRWVRQVTALRLGHP